MVSICEHSLHIRLQLSKPATSYSAFMTSPVENISHLVPVLLSPKY